MVPSAARYQHDTHSSNMDLVSLLALKKNIYMTSHVDWRLLAASGCRCPTTTTVYHTTTTPAPHTSSSEVWQRFREASFRRRKMAGREDDASGSRSPAEWGLLLHGADLALALARPPHTLRPPASTTLSKQASSSSRCNTTLPAAGLPAHESS